MSRDPDLPTTGAEIIPETPVASASGTTRDATDGRVALRLRNRQRVIDALIAMVLEGNISPSMEEIVERSGASERSIFRYFNDLSDLSMSAIRAVVERVEPYRVIEDIGEGSLEHRIDQMIATRLRVSEEVHLFGTLARRKLMLTPEIPKALENVLAMLGDQLREQFAPELDAMSDEQAAIVIDTFVTLFSYEGVEVMWHQLGNDRDAVERRWRTMMHALLGGSADRDAD